MIAKKSMRFSWLQKRAPVKVTPRMKIDMKLLSKAVEKKRRETQVMSIQESSRLSKERLMIRIEKSRLHRGTRLKARLAARANTRR